jgi:hypothetical protein
MIPISLLNLIQTSTGFVGGPFFIIAGDSGFAVSTDGVSWATYSFTGMYAVAGDLNTLVAGGYVATVQNRMAYSTTDGTSWATASPNIATGQILDAASNVSRYILTGYNVSNAGQTFYSTNGINFTQSSYSGGTGYFKSIVSWFPNVGLFVTGDAASTYVHGNLYSSTDGQTFSVLATCSATTTPSTLEAITYGASQSLYVLVGRFSGQSGGTNPWPNASAKKIAYSSDLVTWTQSNVASNISPLDVTYSSKFGRFVTLGSIAGNAGTPVYNPLGTSSIHYSNNGTTWIATSISRNYITVAWSPTLEVFRAVSSDGYIASSTDGITWTEAATLTGFGFIEDIKWISEATVNPLTANYAINMSDTALPLIGPTSTTLLGVVSTATYSQVSSDYWHIRVNSKNATEILVNSEYCVGCTKQIFAVFGTASTSNTYRDNLYGSRWNITGISSMFSAEFAPMNIELWSSPAVPIANQATASTPRACHFFGWDVTSASQSYIAIKFDRYWDNSVPEYKSWSSTEWWVNGVLLKTVTSGNNAPNRYKVVWNKTNKVSYVYGGYVYGDDPQDLVLIGTQSMNLSTEPFVFTGFNLNSTYLTHVNSSAYAYDTTISNYQPIPATTSIQTNNPPVASAMTGPNY